jgi:hypothetical protein
MKQTTLLMGLLAVASIGLGLPGVAHASNLSIGVQADNLQLGIIIGPTPPPSVVVPGPVVAAPVGPPPPMVYTAPNLPYNYFVSRRSTTCTTKAADSGRAIITARGQSSVSRKCLARSSACP